MKNKENQELDDDVMVTIELDGEDLDCEILTIFDIEDQDYIVLMPVDENGEPLDDTSKKATTTPLTTSSQMKNMSALISDLMNY